MERPAKRRRADVYYVTDMHTGRELEFAGAPARTQARGRMMVARIDGMGLVQYSIQAQPVTIDVTSVRAPEQAASPGCWAAPTRTLGGTSGGGGGRVMPAIYFMIRTEAVTEMPLRFESDFHRRFVS